MNLLGALIAVGLFAVTPYVCALEESTAADGSNVQAIHAVGETGEGVAIGFIALRNIRTTHEAFRDPCGLSHAFNYDFSGSGISNPDFHDTTVAGVAISRGGASHPNDKGVAPGADLHCARVVDDSSGINTGELRDALDELIVNQGCRVIVSGFQMGTDSPQPDGDSTWTKIYDYYADRYDVVFANAAGRWHSNVTVFGDAYNGITTGGLVYLPDEVDVYRKVGSQESNSGPTEDGRRKPDVVAPSQSQMVPWYSSDTTWDTVGSPDYGETSWSGPHVAGLAALLWGLADDTATPDDNHSEVIRAVIVNTTFPNILDKSADYTHPADPANTWHPDRGYGRIDGLRAYELLAADQVFDGGRIVGGKGWAFENLRRNFSYSYTVYCKTNDRLVVTLSWDHAMGSVYTRTLSYLDLEVYEPGNPTPVFAGLSGKDNTEKCDILASVSGDYIIRVVNQSNSGSLSRDYGLAVEVLPPLPGDFSEVDYAVNGDDLDVLAGEWLTSSPEEELDLVADGIVDWLDFGVFAQYWQATDPRYFVPAGF